MGTTLNMIHYCPDTDADAETVAPLAPVASTSSEIGAVPASEKTPAGSLKGYYYFHNGEVRGDIIMPEDLMDMIVDTTEEVRESMERIELIKKELLREVKIANRGKNVRDFLRDLVEKYGGEGGIRSDVVYATALKTLSVDGALKRKSAAAAAAAASAGDNAKKKRRRSKKRDEKGDIVSSGIGTSKSGNSVSSKGKVSGIVSSASSKHIITPSKNIVATGKGDARNTNAGTNFKGKAPESIEIVKVAQKGSKAVKNPSTSVAMKKLESAAIKGKVENRTPPIAGHNKIVLPTSKKSQNVTIIGLDLKEQGINLNSTAKQLRTSEKVGSTPMEIDLMPKSKDTQSKSIPLPSKVKGVTEVKVSMKDTKQSDFSSGQIATINKVSATAAVKERDANSVSLHEDLAPGTKDP